MDRQAHEYATAMALAQQQQQQASMQPPQQFGFHPQSQQFPHQVHGPPFLPPHPSIQQFPPYHRHFPPPQQLFPPRHLPLNLQQQQQSLPAFGPQNPPPHLMAPTAYAHPYEPAAPPSDPELQKRIDKLVEYAAKNGPEFEAMIRDKQHDNPDYSFLFGGEGHNYYRYKIWLSTRSSGAPFLHSFPPPSMPMMPSSHNPMLNSSVLNPLPLGTPTGPVLGGPPLHQPSYPPFYEQHQQPLQPQPFMGQSRADYELPTKSFKGLSGPLPSDVAAELNNVLTNLTGTKESIKGAKMWFMQRLPFAPALAEALRDRIFALDDSERQMHIIFLANDILFDSLQHRINSEELDNEALAFRPVLGSMLARIYNNPHNKDDNQSRLEKILQFWATKEVYNQETIASLEREMTGGLPFRSAAQMEAITASDPSSFTGLTPQQWPDKQNPDLSSLSQEITNKHVPPASAPPFVSVVNQQFVSNQQPGVVYPPTVQTSFSGTLPVQQTVPPTGIQPSMPHLQPNSATDQTPPPYPLFPPALIPGMVRKMQIGSGVPYSPLSPLDIPTVIPPSTASPSEILDRVSKFFKEIGEINPSEGPMKQSVPNDEYDDYERDPLVRKGGACIPPPPNLQLDPETGAYTDGSVDRKAEFGGSGRLGLGASANSNEVSQYDDVYSSYRKQRSTSYHSSMSARAATR